VLLISSTIAAITPKITITVITRNGQFGRERRAGFSGRTGRT
jgi:hypothetical protein